MTSPAAVPATSLTFESFRAELSRLVHKFESELQAVNAAGYSEARVRQDYLDPFFRALGWDLENRAGLVQHQREVEIESRTDIAGRAKKADYLFRTGRRDRFICEAKKPRETLGPRYAFQAKRYAWNKDVPLAVLTDFEELKIYVVGGRPHIDDEDAGLWKRWEFRDFPSVASELWKLLAQESVAAGSVDGLIESLPKAPARARGRARQLYLIKPDRTRALDADFLNYLDEARRDLASDLLRRNERSELLEGGRLNEAVQSILDRLLFLRICEDRDIETGMRLQSVVERWRRGRTETTNEDRPLLRAAEEPAAGGEQLRRHRGEPLWGTLLANIRALDRRPPTHVPYFNGNLFKAHFSEHLLVSDEWLADFIGDLSSDESPYLFSVIPVEILGSVYERFLGKVVRPHGRGVVIEEKPEVRRAGGVYYTPRYVVDFIVEEALGRELNGIIKLKTRDAFENATRSLRVLDPACGSGSFLIRVFERFCDHWLQWLTLNSDQQRKTLCWTDPATDDLHLTVDLKRRILLDNIFGVDIDGGAVEVTQLSLYLKMLEGESRITLDRQRELLSRETPLLPSLETNIKRGNSLISSDFSMVPNELVRVHAFDWAVAFRDIMKAGGFAAVVGNPPYVLLQDEFRDDTQLAYFRRAYEAASFKLDTYHLFIERGIQLCREGGRLSLITPANFLTNNHLDGLRRLILRKTQPEQVTVVDGGVFEGVSVDNAVFVFRAGKPATQSFPMSHAVAEASGLSPTSTATVSPKRVLTDKSALFTSGAVSSIGSLWDRLVREHRKLGGLADVNFGKQLRDRKKFARDVIQVQSKRDIPRTHVPCVTGKDIERYNLRWSGLACLNSTVAQSGGCWDESKHEAKNKLLTRQIGRYPTFALDDVGYHCLNTLFMVTIREPGLVQPEYLLGILNSSVFRALWLGRFYDQRRTFPKIKGTYLKEMPIAVAPDKARRDRLAALVTKMLQLVSEMNGTDVESARSTLKNAVAATEERINSLVAEVYGLTVAEITLVENTN